MNSLELQIEALIFASDLPIKVEEIIICLQSCFEKDFATDEVLNNLKNITEKYNHSQFAISLIYTGNGYQFLTKDDYFTIINQLQIQRSKKRLSQASLETLAIVAYRQPVTKLEIEQIRGVNCDYTIQKLLEKEFIIINGKGDAPGKPLLYVLSNNFLDYFGINSIADLPQIKDIEENAESIIGKDNNQF